jgi:antitoxin MazE
MKATIQKWGNSLGVRIPKVMADDLKLQNGSEVELFEDSDKIIIQPRRKAKLDDLLSAINEDNLHGEVSSGDPAGREIW